MKLAVGFVLGLIAGVAVTMTGIALIPFVDPFAADHEWFEKRVAIGMTEEAVLRNLGQPLQIVDGGEAPDDYYVEGWSYRERAISGKVLIYIRREPICYVWLDRAGIVEDYFVGGS